jgi:hypothetical protein
MRDARLLVWVLAEPTRAAQLSAAQWQAIARIAAAEGLAAVLCARVSAADVPPDVQAVLAFGSRARGEAQVDSDLDLVVAGHADAERLSGSRWHGFGDVAREGRVLHVAG